MTTDHVWPNGIIKCLGYDMLFQPQSFMNSTSIRKNGILMKIGSRWSVPLIHFFHSAVQPVARERQASPRGLGVRCAGRSRCAWAQQRNCPDTCFSGRVPIMKQRMAFTCAGSLPDQPQIFVDTAEWQLSGRHSIGVSTTEDGPSRKAGVLNKWREGESFEGL